MHLHLATILMLAALGQWAQAADIRTQIQGAKPGTVIQCSGTYTVTAKIAVPAGVTVKGPAKFIFTTGTVEAGFYVRSGQNNVVLQDLEVTGAKQGIWIQGSNCTLTRCTAHGNNNTGIEIRGGGAAGNTVQDCTSYDNADPAGGNAVGFTCKDGTGTGNKFLRCTAYSNSDDGWDLAYAANPVVLTDCKSHDNGLSLTTRKSGNGEGFKLGISGDNTAHQVTRCEAYNNTKGNSAKGFSVNGNIGKVVITSCSSHGNRRADTLGNAVVSSDSTMQK